MQRSALNQPEPDEPGAKAPAPGALRIVQQFINSADIEAGTEELSSPEALSGWLHDHGLTERRTRLRADDLERALEFRELLRLVVMTHNGRAIDSEAIRAVNRQLEKIELVARFENPDSLRIEGATAGVEGALARMVGIIHAEMQTGRWRRLKVCARDVCRWVFYDHSRNHTGTWCSMTICGARTKSGNYYRRRHPQRSAFRSS